MAFTILHCRVIRVPFESTCAPSVFLCVYKSMERIYFLALMLSLVTANSVAYRRPPEITNFLQKDLVNPEDVEFKGFKLPCGAAGTNISWTWKHNDTEITSFRRSPHYSLNGDGTLTGKYLSSQHSGTYQCIVKDKDTKIEVFSRKLKVAITAPGDFIDRERKSVKVDLGKPFRFQCPKHAAGFGSSYAWVKPSNIHLSRNERRGISPDGTLLIAYLTQKDMDEINYDGVRCRIRAGNTYEDSGKLFLVKNNPQQTDPGTPVALSWASKPAVDELAIEGRRKILYCFVNGRPTPEITWKKNGTRIVHGQNSYEIPRHYFGHRLVITNVNRESHQDVYTCEANNSRDNDNPMVHSINLEVKVKPAFVTKPRNQTVLEKGTTTFYCNAKGRPPPNITWVKDGVTVGLGSTLRFETTWRKQSGRYWCHAKNGLNYVINASAFLNVLYVPSPPVNVTITHCNDWRVELHWIPSPSTAAPITYYLIEQASSEDPVRFGLLYKVSIPDTTSKTFNVCKDSFPRFRIRAVNNVGKSLPSSPVNTTCQGTETDFGASQPEVTKTLIYQKAWFLTILVLVAFVVLISALAMFFISYYKGRGKKYEVGKRERERGYNDQAKQSEENIEEEEISNLVGNAEKSDTTGGNILHDTCLLQYHLADDNDGEDLVFDVAPRGNRKYGKKKPFYPTQKSTLDAMKAELSENAPSVACRKVSSASGGMLGAQQPGQLMIRFDTNATCKNDIL
ncbi:Neuroglian [Stylophora pistillata]|uniref:Neuroglian n=1 Tax=Stylophora pistillata TaxID=50429 RepID=A0A2B4RPG6_STYPI|nr:Neuroglian [Stylophora pistillata]